MFNHISRKDTSVFNERYLTRYPLLIAMRCSDDCSVCHPQEELVKKINMGSKSKSETSLTKVQKELAKESKMESKIKSESSLVQGVASHQTLITRVD